jgi:DDE superfamily endonuclease
LKKDPASHFDPQQYIVGDSAFENDWFMVSAFKKLANSFLTEDQELFNTKLSRLRIISEHCIGMLKGRFPWLRQIRLLITEDKRSIVRILCLIDASVILHNMLIDFGEDNIDAWIDYDDFSDMDDAQRAPYEDGDDLNRSVPAWMPKDTRRTRLLHYFKEFFFLT